MGDGKQVIWYCKETASQMQNVGHHAGWMTWCLQQSMASKREKKTWGDWDGMEKCKNYKLVTKHYLWALCGSWFQQATVYRHFWESQGNLTMACILDDTNDLLVIFLAGIYVLKAKALSVRGAFLGIYRGNHMSYICFKIPQPSTSPK